MELVIPTSKPFSFAQTLAFIRRFPPCQGEYLIADDAVTAAISIGGKATSFTLRGGAEVTIDTPSQAIARRAADWIGANDDLSALYTAARSDPPFRALVSAMHGLHHVRFLTLPEIAVYCVMMQRTPITKASRMKRAFLARFGKPVEVAGHTLRAMPEMSELVTLDGGEIGAAIKHPPKGMTIAGVVRGVAAIGEDALRTLPYAEARDALLEVPGIGPFSAAAILLRGLGRMDELPSMRTFEAEARVLYGEAYDPEAIARRYGRDIGYWSFYLKTGVARMAS